MTAPSRKPASSPAFFALIPCAGTGSRANGGAADAPPKQYQPVAGKPMVMHALAAFSGVARMKRCMVVVSKGGKARHPVFREYFEMKVKEGKNKPQALVCVARRLVRIIYGMMKTKTEYRPYDKMN